MRKKITLVLGMKANQGESVIWLFSKILPSMESSGRDLVIDIVVDRFLFKNTQITFSFCFTFTPETGVRLPKTEVSFYCEAVRHECCPT